MNTNSNIGTNTNLLNSETSLRENVRHNSIRNV